VRAENLVQVSARILANGHAFVQILRRVHFIDRETTVMHYEVARTL
jgi:hypothetical protein